jgi:serine/threonine protein kinase
MQPSPHEVGKPDALPTGGEGARSDDESTPVPGGDSSENSWASLGSTRVIEGNTPHSLPRAVEQFAQAQSDPRDVMPRTGREPVSFGDFQLLNKIGEGAMGAVYKARQLSFGRDVALKVLFPHIANNPKLVERLYREGRVMGQLDHPNIVQAFEVNESHGWHYIALEYVDGQSMQKWLAHLGRLNIGDALHIVVACARALEYAHNLGFVHRDIKPDNILIDGRGNVKVADLGMVKIDDEDLALTQTGHAVGTPWYMPLEQAKNAKDTDRRSDIYALGCMLYCFLTGMPPFAGKTLLEVIRAKDLGTFPPTRQANPEVPERLDLIIIKMASKQPKHRYQSCAELIRDLESLQLAHAKLEFLEHKNAPTEVAATKAPSSHDDPRPVAVADPNTWYVRVKDAEGNTAVHKLVTAQVQSMLAEDLLPPNAKASHDREVGFRALATYKEFQGSALVKASKQSADQHTARYRSLYRKIEEEAEQRERDKEVATAAPGTPDWLPLALKIGAGAVGFLLFIWLISLLSR